MSCKIQIKAVNYLRNERVIGDKLIITDYSKFQELNNTLTELAHKKYSVGDGKMKLFDTTTRSARALDGSFYSNIVISPNERLFNILDEAVDSYKEGEVKITESLSELVGENVSDKLMASVQNNKSEDFGGINEFILFDGKDSVSNASDVLRNIIKNFEGFSEASTEFVEKAISILDKTNANIQIVEADDLKEADTFMEYRPKGNVIKLSKSKLREATPEYVVSSFLHEVIHSLTVNVYDNPTKMEHHMFKDFINDAFESYKEKADNTESYGFKDVYEFMSEAFTNPLFQQELQSIDKGSKKKSFWAKFIDFLRTIVGLRKQTKYEQVIDEISNILESSENSESSKVFEKKEATKEDPYTSLKTIEDKVSYAIKKMNTSLDINIKKNENLSKRQAYFKNEKGAERLKEYATSLRELQGEINSYQGAERILSVLTFTVRMSTAMNYVQKQLDKADYTDEKNVARTIKNYEQYLQSYSVIKELEDLLANIKENRDQDVISNEELNNMITEVSQVKGQYEILNKRVYHMKANYMKGFLTDIKYFPQLVTKHRERLRLEHTAAKNPAPLKAWTTKMMNTRDKPLIEKELKEVVEEFITDPIVDIGGSNVWFNSAINTSSPIIQIAQQMFSELKNDRAKIERTKDQEFKKLWEKLVAEKGTNAIDKLYKNIIDTDKETGQAYYKGEYKLGVLKIIDQQAALREEAKELVATKGINSKEYKDIRKKVEALEAANFVKIDGKLQVKEKWKNDMSKLSTTEKEVLSFFKEVIDTSNRQTMRTQSLIKYVKNAKFYELPKVTKSDAERVWDKGLAGIAKDRWSDLTKVRVDDVGYYEVNVDTDNNQIKDLRVHYRDSQKNPMNAKDQSLDLMTITRLEFKNGNIYDLRSKAEMKFTLLSDLASNKKYYQKEGTRKVFSKNDKKINIIEGTHSNTAKMMNNMLEAQLYDMFHKTGTKISGVDLNKAVGFFNSVNAFIGLSLNVASGTANVVNANAQLFLESFVKGQFITAEGVRKANSLYGQDLHNTMKDSINPIKHGFVNQVNELFDVQGLFNLSEADFLKSDLAKKGLSTESLQIFQNTGEHWIQSVTTMAVLAGVKVMNESGNFINKEGKEVATEKEAASMLDMLERDKDDVVQISDKVVYTTHSKMTRMNEGGKERIDMLIKKKLYDTIGNYTQDTQTEIYRHWYGKLTMMYRKYLIPMGVSRWRGLAYSFKAKEDLEDDERTFSYALQEYEEGTYVTLLRYMYTSLKDKKFNLLSKTNWDTLSDYEKHNVKRSVTELIMSMVAIPLILMFMGAMADDDDELMFFSMYQLRRLDSELSQYRSIGEAFKVMRSPIPSARIVETGLDILGQMFSPTEIYRGGFNKDKNKLKTKVLKQVPGVKEWQRSFKDLFEFQNSTWGSSK